MFYSVLKIDVDAAPGRLWLRNLYRVHQRLCMAFPSSDQTKDDPEFLKPFNPDGFQHVHGERTDREAFLFRIDPQAGGSPVIVVQSAVEPDWDYAFQNVTFLIAAESRQCEPLLQNGQLLRFRLMANPTKRLSKNSTGADGNPVKKDSVGKRVPVDKDKLNDWLIRHAEKSGFMVDKKLLNVQTGYVIASKGKDDKLKRFFYARYDGSLKVTEAPLFKNALMGGIGPAKGFGFGLLSIAPVKS